MVNEKNITLTMKMVNIFIIVPDIQKTAEMLDDKRLGKSRVEAYQIINCLEEYDRTGQITQGWRNHPALKSWFGFTNHLKVYFNIITREWIRRGFVNNMTLYSIDERPYHIVPCGFDGKSISYDSTKFNAYSFPFWISFYPFYMSHQAALCRKNPKHYKFLLREELNYFLNFGYLWPCNATQSTYTDWNYTYHEGLACGTPPIYRINSIEVLTWLKDTNKNPKTNRKITPKSEIYKDYENAMKAHQILIYNNVVYYKSNPICYINQIDNGIGLLVEFFNKNGGIPDARQLVYEIANTE